MISTDRNIFDPDSQVGRRTIKYGELFEKLDVIVFAKKGLGLTKTKLSERATVYPTNSTLRWFYISDALKIAGSLAKKADVITTQDPFETGLVGREIKKNFGIPLVVQIHTDFGSPFFSRSVLNKVRLHILNKVVKKADIIRVVSRKIKTDLIRKHKIPENIVYLLPIHVDLSKYEKNVLNKEFERKYEKWDKIALMASRLTEEKAVHVGVKAFATISKYFPKTALIVVGDGPKKRNLQRLTESLNLSDKVFFEGWMSNMSDAYNLADVFINTSLYEGYGMSLVEASASDCMLITTRVGIAHDFLPNEAIVLNQGDISGFASALTEILSDDEKRIRMARSLHSKIKIESISFDEYLRRYKLILELATKGGSGK